MEKFWVIYIILDVVLFAITMGLLVSRMDLSKINREATQALEGSNKKIKELTWRDRLGKPPFGLRRMTDMVDTLDLVRVRSALKEDGWNDRRIQKAEKEYRRFLFLFGVSGEHICPWGGKGSDLDLFWHRHILDMKQYEKDCTELFGMIFYHEPSLEKDPRKTEERTQELYHMHFTPCTTTLVSRGKNKTVTPSLAASTTYQDSSSWLPWVMYAPFLMDSTAPNHEKLGVSQDQPIPTGSDAFIPHETQKGSGSAVSAGSATVVADSGIHHGDTGGGHHATSPGCSSSCSGGGSGCSGGGGCGGGS